MEVVSQSSVISLESDTDDDGSTPMLTTAPQKALAQIGFPYPKNETLMNDDEQISRIRRLSRMMDRNDMAGMEVLSHANDPLAKADPGVGYGFQQTSPRRNVDNAFRDYVGTSARSRSLPFPGYNGLMDDVVPTPGPSELPPGQRAFHPETVTPGERYLDLARRNTTQFDDELEDFEDDLDQRAYRITRWQSPFEDDYDLEMRDQHIDLTDEPNRQSYDEVLAKILEVLPDICPDHVRTKYQERLPSINADTLLNDILADDKYPRRKPKTKRAREEDDGDAKAWMDNVTNDQLVTA